MKRSIVGGVIAITVVVLGTAMPAAAQDDSRDPEAFVVLSGPANVPRGERVGDLVVFHGTANVEGTVDGSLTAFDAPVTISGTVDGDVVVFNGRVVLGEGATVTGDVVSRSDPVVASGATIEGDTRRVETHVNWGQFGWVGRFVWWLAVSVSTLVVGLVFLWLAGRGTARILEAGRSSVGPSIGWGALLFFGLPIVAILILVTVVAIPLGLGLLAALGLIYAIGYAAAAWILGRSIVAAPTGWVVAFLVGWGILRLAALVPVLGGLVWWAAVVFGLGALIVAVWRARSSAAPPAAAPPAAAPPAPAAG